MDNKVIYDAEDTQLIQPVKTYKMIAFRGKVVFPGQAVHFDLVRDKSYTAISQAVESGESVFLVAQKRATMVNPAPQDIYRVGVLATIKQVQRLPGDAMRVVFIAGRRMQIDSYVSLNPYFEVTLKEYDYDPDEPVYFEAIKRRLDEQFKEYRRIDTKMPGDVLSSLSVDDGEKFVSTIASYIFSSDSEKQNVLQTKTLSAQYELILTSLAKETEIRAMEKRITARVRQNIDKNQKEYYIREQIRVLKEELGEDADEIDELREKLRGMKDEMPQTAYEKAEKEISRLEKMSSSTPEASVARSYIELLLDMPWQKSTVDDISLDFARKVLAEDHYGLEKVKGRILEYLAVFKLTQNLKAPVLCFVGPPGVGKTSIVRSIARAAGKELVTMSLGGIHDEAEIRGHRRTYVAAMPGRIINGIRQAKVNNPVFLLDEIDKMTADIHGDPASALLEVLDPNQNNNFKDNYLDMPFDLSKVMFVTTANSLDPLPAALLDRLEVIELSGYTYEEKLQIAKRYLKPKEVKANGLSDVKVDMSDAVISHIISSYTRESGVRNLEREIATVMRKIALKVVEQDQIPATFKVSKKDIAEFLGPAKYKETSAVETDEVGAATGLAWTSVGGVTLSIEAAIISGGKGELKLTGSLGDVMKESCLAALSLVRSRAAEYGVKETAFSENDVHLHFPEGATPKDGPSAGITIATALMSAFSKKAVAHDVAMTGEVTLRGKVLAIGGLKEKSLAAFRAGYKRLIIPKENEKDLTDVPDEVKQKVNIITVENIDQVFAAVLK
ncbi:endopeptidase La [Anaerocaecibacter muris]|uniref:endopeptidase La n=1 Tax=Anaerocaecibacter muris TaxID=2941513 RepID=UPI0020407574|nr:endopeptidase La [Anaerocaecibacter muris]